MASPDYSQLRTTTVLLASALLASGCSSSIDPVSLADSDDGDSILNTQLSLSDIANQSIIKLAGYQSEQLGLVVDLLASEVIENATAEMLSGTEFISGTSQPDPTTADIQRKRYACQNGGAMVHETGRISTFTSSSTISGYSFDQCILTASVPSLEEGSFELNGYVQTDESLNSGSRSHQKKQQIEWSNFSLAGPLGLNYAITGSTNYWENGGANYTTRERNAHITYYRKTENGQTEELDSVVFSVNNDSLNAGVQFSTSMSMSGTFQGDLSTDNSISISTIHTIERLRGVGPAIDTSVPLAGEIEFISSGGGVLYLTANAELHPTNDTTVVLMNHNETDEAGNNSIQQERNFMINLALWAASCVVNLDAETSAAACTESESIIVP